MRALGVARPVVAAAIATVTACSIWAAIDNPYKSDAVDAGGVRDAAAARVRIIEAGFAPYAIAVHDDNVYVLDNQGQVHVAHDASTSFDVFWTGDGGDIIYPRTNEIAASASGVFWTVYAGVRYCAVDGGDCGLLPTMNPRAIAATDTLVAWIENRGVRVCATSLATCNPVTLDGSRGAELVAAGPDGSVAWADGGSIIHVGDTAIDLFPHVVPVMAIDPTSGDIYWEEKDFVGLLPSAGGTGATLSLPSQLNPPTELFAKRGVLYWSLRGFATVSHCRFDPDAGCTASDLPGYMNDTVNDGIVATSREVLAIVSSPNNAPSQPMIVAWPLPR